jgi:uncharacterized protein HemX
MIFLGLVVAVAAVAVGVGVVLDNNGPAELTVYGQTVSGLSTQWQLFLAGAAVAIVFMAGMTIMTLGMGRSIRQHRELRDLRYEHTETMTTLEMEKRQLQRELARARQESSGIGSLHSQGYAPRSS